MTLFELTKALHQLAREEKKRIFSLRELAAFSNESRPAVGMALRRAKIKGLVAHVRSVWINQLDPPVLEEIAFSLASPSYISFESALYHHGVLSQSPRGELTVATLGRPSVVETPFGVIRFIHLQRQLFFGFDVNRVAWPEKAWLDLLYIRGLRGPRNQELLTEEVYLNELNAQKIAKLTRRFPPWIRNLRAKF